MTDSLPLYVVPPGRGAAFAAERMGGFALITPLSAPADIWLRGNLTPGASWDGDRLVVEMRYFPALADAIIAAGFLFEGDPEPHSSMH